MAKRRKLGTTELQVGPLVLGGNVFGWTVDEAMSFRLLDAYVAAGLNFIDTADVYSRWATGNEGGESETVLGKWFQRTGNRSKVVLATKVGWEMGPTAKGLSRSYILRAVERSLNRLQTDVIDLYQAHIDDPETPLEETLGAFGELIQQGKVRAIGASNYTAERLTQALEVSRSQNLLAYSCLQPLYNLYDRAVFEDALEPLCAKAGLGVIPYFSLARGFLTGKYRSEQDLGKSVRGQSAKQYLNQRGLRILAGLDAVAARLGSTPGRVALAWLMARPTVTAPIASATNLDQMADLIAATQLELDAAAMAALNEVSR